MSAISSDEPPSAADRTAVLQGFQQRGFWHNLAQALEAAFVNRTRHAVPEIELRRSRYEIKRCRRLMLAAAPRDVGAAHASSRRAAQAGGA